MARPRSVRSAHSCGSTPSELERSRLSSPLLLVAPCGDGANLATTRPPSLRQSAGPVLRAASGPRRPRGCAPDRRPIQAGASSRRTAAAIRLRASTSGSTSRSATAARSRTSRASGSAASSAAVEVAIGGGQGEERPPMCLVAEQLFDQPAGDRIPVLGQQRERGELGILAHALLVDGRPRRPGRRADASRPRRDRRPPVRSGRRPRRRTACAR